MSFEKILAKYESASKRTDESMMTASDDPFDHELQLESVKAVRDLWHMHWVVSVELQQRNSILKKVAQEIK